MAIDGEPSQAGDEGHDQDATVPDPTHYDTAPDGSTAMLGVHLVTDSDPDAAAQRMAATDDIEVVNDRDHANAAFAARAEAGRTAVVVIGDRERAELEAAAAFGPEYDAATPEAIAAIRQLADDLRRIERIRQRTEDRFTEALNERLAAGTGLALHPDTLRAAGRVVVDVETEIDRIERELRTLEESIETPEPTDDDTHTQDEPNSHPRRANRVAAIIVVVIVLVAAAGLAAVAAPAIAGVVAIAGLIVAIVLARRGHHGTSETSEVAPTPPTPRMTPEEEQARLVARSRLETGLERARERQRSAERHWESLAGPDADAHDIEAVLRLRDPQYVVSDGAARAFPTVRTVNAVHRRTLARWRVAWAAVGYDDAPALDRFEAALRGLAARPQTDPDAARKRLAAADAWTAAGATIDRTLVLVEPALWLPAGELATLMAMLPAGAEVIVVQRS